MSATNPAIRTGGDALAADLAGQAAITAAAAAAAAANKTFADAQVTGAAARTEFVNDLALLGSMYAADPDNAGGIVVYVSDPGVSSDSPGFHVLRPKPVSASVEPTPTTAPTPAPTP